MICLCEECFPDWGSHQVYSTIPLSPCDECGKLDNRLTKEYPVVRAHMFGIDPRKIIHKPEPVND